jgi:hypothetical protein
MVEQQKRTNQSRSGTSDVTPKREYQSKATVTSPEPAAKVNEKASSPDLVNPETRNRAIAFAGYDKSRIERLLASVRSHHPNKSEQWYWEKILYDMERDRGF